VDQKVMQATEIKQLAILNKEDCQVPIQRVQASGYNSAAFNSDNQCWIWGDRKCGKLGNFHAVQAQ